MCLVLLLQISNHTEGCGTCGLHNAHGWWILVTLISAIVFSPSNSEVPAPISPLKSHFLTAKQTLGYSAENKNVLLSAVQGLLMNFAFPTTETVLLIPEPLIQRVTAHTWFQNVTFQNYLSFLPSSRPFHVCSSSSCCDHVGLPAPAAPWVTNTTSEIPAAPRVANTTSKIPQLCCKPAFAPKHPNTHNRNYVLSYTLRRSIRTK